MPTVTAIADTVSGSLRTALQVLAEFDLHSVTLRRLDGRMPHEYPRALRRETRLLLEDAPAVLDCVVSSFGQAQNWLPGEMTRQLDVLKRSAELARELNCRALSAQLSGVAGGERAPWEVVPSILERVIPVLSDFEVALVFENGRDAFFSSGEDLLRFLDMYREEKLLQAAWNPAAEVPCTWEEETIAALAQRVVRITFADVALSPAGPRPAFPGDGLVQWPNLAERLREANSSLTYCHACVFGLGDISERTHARLAPQLRDGSREDLARASLRQMLAWLEM